MTDAIAPPPLLTRLKLATIAAPDLAPIEAWYSEWLGYSVVERGQVEPALANSWGAPAVANRPYILMKPESGSDVHIRAVESQAVEGFRGLTTFGWSAFEIIVDDVYALNERLLKGPFEIVGPPQSIGPDLANIHAMQVIGPAQEVLYLTCDTGPKADSILPDAGAPVGRLFIVVLCGADIWTIHDFYTQRFQIVPGAGRDTSVSIINNALGLPADQRMAMTFVGLKEAGNFIEVDGYPPPATERPHVDGELPPGNAIVGFSVDSLDDLDIEFIAPPITNPSAAYGGGRTACFRGPVGELVELIEDPR
jgi:catechol 2,3-dioxygenase-like lactoylglutathione lyase family enzyme